MSIESHAEKLYEEHKDLTEARDLSQELLGITEQQRLAHEPAILDPNAPPGEIETQRQLADMTDVHRHTYEQTERARQANISSAEWHLGSHRDEYQEMALHDAAEAGVPIVTHGASNIREIFNQGGEILPGVSRELFKNLYAATERTGADYAAGAVMLWERHGIDPSNAEQIEWFERTCYQLAISDVEVRAVTSSHLHGFEIMKSIMRGQFDARGYNPVLPELPHVQDALDTIGLSYVQQVELFHAWMGYEPLLIAINSPSQLMHPAKLKQEVSGAIASKINRELSALSEYQERYGTDELRTLIHTFGIRHFSRYTPESLHDQVERFEKGDRPIENVVILPTADWNAAFDTHDKSMESIFPPGSAVFFEASRPTELARAIVKVGQYERRFGRDPESGNYVKNVIIGGHGSPEDITLGDESTFGDHATINRDQYFRAQARREKIGARINTYRRHLGSRFHLILDSCSTAGRKIGIIKNIAHMMSDEHDAMVQASPVSVHGIQDLTDEGEVIYKLAEQGVLLPAARLDGRDGGVLETASVKTRLAKWASLLGL